MLIDSTRARQDRPSLRDPPRASRHSHRGGGRAPHRRRGPCSCSPPGRRRARWCCCSATRSPGSARPGPSTAPGRRPSSARGRVPSACRRTFRGPAVERAAGIRWWRRGWPRRSPGMAGTLATSRCSTRQERPWASRPSTKSCIVLEPNGVPCRRDRDASPSYGHWSAIS